MDNLKLYESFREVPEAAKSIIEGGRMNGKTNINPMWRIKILTKTFGIVGFGWKTKTVRKFSQECKNGEILCFVDIELYIKHGNEWSAAIEGSGSKKISENTKNGVYNNEECYKMAYTDALGVACKSLGIGADVYWETDKHGKYQNQERNKKLERVKTIIFVECNRNKNKSIELLETLTTETVKGKIVKGVRDFESLTDQQLTALETKLKKLYKEYYKIET